MEEQENKKKRSGIAGFFREKLSRLADQGKGKDSRDGCSSSDQPGC